MLIAQRSNACDAVVGRSGGGVARGGQDLTPQIPLSLSFLLESGPGRCISKNLAWSGGDWFPPGLWCCVSRHEWMPSKPLFWAGLKLMQAQARRRGQARQSTTDTPPSRRACFGSNLSRGCADALQMSWCVTDCTLDTVAPQSPSRLGRFGSPPTWASLPRAVCWTVLRMALAEVVAGECRRQSWLAGRRQPEEGTLLANNIAAHDRASPSGRSVKIRTGFEDGSIGRKQHPARWVSSENNRRGHTPRRLILGRRSVEAQIPSKYGRDRSSFGYPPAVAQPTTARLSGAGGRASTSGGRTDPPPSIRNFHSSSASRSLQAGPASAVSHSDQLHQAGTEVLICICVHLLFFSPGRLLHLSMQTLRPTLPSSNTTSPRTCEWTRTSRHPGPSSHRVPIWEHPQSPAVPGRRVRQSAALGCIDAQGQPREPREPSNDNGRWHTQRWGREGTPTALGLH